MTYRFMRYPGGKYKAVTLSYDDNSVHNCKLLEKLNNANLKCTFNLNSECFVDKSSGLTEENVRNLLIEYGHEIAVHGEAHRSNGIVSPLEGIRDVLNCREQLETIFGGIIRGMAYPDTGISCFHNGSSYETVRQYLHNLGIVYSRTLGPDNNKFLLPTDFYAWIPTAHHNNPQLFSYIEEFISLDITTRYHAEHFPRLFYLWGHSQEFEINQNWELLDRICDALSSKEDIWYATNMQIYEYVKGYEALVWNAKYNEVYNPNLFPIWFALDLKVYCVEPGQTINIK